MNILIVNNVTIPTLKYYGTERIIWDLGKELNSMGHSVFFLVKSGSYCNFAKILEIDECIAIEDQIPEYIDVVHFNSYSPRNYNKPYIVTIHDNNISENPSLNSVFVSKNHASRFNSSSFVINGLDWSNYGKIKLNKARNNYHFLGKAAYRAKTVNSAIDIIKKSNGVKLDVLKDVRFNFKMGLFRAISTKVNFHGTVNNTKKQYIIEQSRGLIFPITWHEPSGLAIIESLYMGSPIFATPYGAFSEIITNEVGFLSNNQNEMVEHINENNDYNPHICNQYARDMFNSRLMAEAYMKKYDIVLNGTTLTDTPPKVINKKNIDLHWYQ